MNRNNTIICFDIDQVLLESQLLLPFLWEHKTEILQNILFRPWTICSLLYQGFREIGAIEKWLYFFEQREMWEMVKIVKTFLQRKKLMVGTATLLLELHQKGYTLMYATNMGSQEMQYHLQQQPLFRKCFSAGKAVVYKNKEDYQYRPEDRVQKPQLLYFQELKQLRQPLEAAAVADDDEGVGRRQQQLRWLFIDDVKKNVMGSIEAGFVGIHFTSAKQLYKALVELNILE